MASNGLTIAANNCDIEISVGTEVHGYFLMGSLVETRGSTFAGQVGSGAPTYQQAEPFSRAVWDKFGGGLGQTEQNRIFGGVGMGGNNEKYLKSDAHTLLNNILAPGMARNLLLPNYTNPYPSKLSVPKGVLPSKHPQGALTKYTQTGTTGYRRLRILVRLDIPQVTNFNVELRAGSATGTLVATYVCNPTDFMDRQGFAWAECDAGTAPTLVNGTVYYIKVNYNSNATIGCFVGDLDGTEDVLQPYVVPIRTTSVPLQDFTQWDDNIRRIEIVNVSGVLKPVALTDTTMFPPESPTLGSYTYSPTNPYMWGSCVFDNKLYVGVGGTAGQGTLQFTAAEAVNGSSATPANTLSGVVMGSNTYSGGKLYFLDVLDGAIKKWTGNFPATGADAVVTIVNANKIGKANSNGKNTINSIFIHRGSLYVLKPEGVFMFYGEVERISTEAEPRFVQIVRFEELEHPDNGKFVCEFQNTICFNVRQYVYQLRVSQDGNDLIIHSVPIDIERHAGYNYVNNVTSDGANLYVGINNLGVYAFNNIGWHWVTDYYYVSVAAGVEMALRFAINPSGSHDYLYIADADALIRMPVPARTNRYSKSIQLKDQNKCFYWISSFWDGDLANIQKTLFRVGMRAFPAGWRYKIIGAFYQTGEPNFRTIADVSWAEGLAVRDYWLQSGSPSATGYPVVTKKILDGSGLPTSTDSPIIFSASEFYNSKAYAQDNVTPDHVDRPVTCHSFALIVYGWNPTGDQDTDTDDMTYIESIVLEYLPVLDYVGVWQVRIDVDALHNGELGTALTTTQINDSLAWLRARAGSKTPTRFKIKNFEGISSTKTIVGYIVNPQFVTDPLTTQKGDILPKQVAFQIMAIETEYV